jgi:hypothetical protein
MNESFLYTSLIAAINYLNSCAQNIIYGSKIKLTFQK